MPQNAISINGDYVAFLTAHLSLVHVITPDDLIGTRIKCFKAHFYTLSMRLNAL